MKTADSLRKLIHNSIVETSVQTDQRILKDALERLQKVRQDRLAGARPNVWRLIMKTPITKLATAAIVAIACLIGLSLWRGTESGIALADVLARIEQVKAVRSQWSEKATGEDPNEPYYYEVRGTRLSSQEYGWKSKVEDLDPNGGESTFREMYLYMNTLITIWPKQKKYQRTEFDNSWGEMMQRSDPRKPIKGILKYKYESLGRSTMDGIEVAGFRTTDPNHWGGKNPQVDIKLWVDVKTLLPVRYDSLASAEVNQRGDKISTHYVEYDYQWDIPVDAAEFKPVIPDDYTGTVVKLPAHITEETAIQGLKALVDLLGKYPEKLPDSGALVLRLAEKSETPAAMRLKEEIKGLTEDEIGNKLVDFLVPIRGLIRYWKLGLDNKDPAYYGKTVTLKDADKVLMRWKVSDNEYRVIYGDLHAETVTPEKLAELEAALPK